MNKNDTKLNKMIDTANSMTFKMFSQLDAVEACSLTINGLSEEILMDAKSLKPYFYEWEYAELYSRISNQLKAVTELASGTASVLPYVTAIMTSEESKEYVRSYSHNKESYFRISRTSILTILKNNWRRIMRDIYEKAYTG